MSYQSLLDCAWACKCARLVPETEPIVLAFRCIYKSLEPACTHGRTCEIAMS